MLRELGTPEVPAQSRTHENWQGSVGRGARFARPRPVAAAALKRGLDVVVAAIALLLLAPVFAIVAVLIVLDSPGPVFYRAERVGFRGRPLRMLKFRKMRADATGAALTTGRDPRLTRAGAWLVATRLDELPQLWHVLRGDMSLVGPRPEHLGFVARHPADYRRILCVRPGLAGWSQLAFADERSLLDPEDPLSHYLDEILPQKVALDRLYASRYSVRRDVGILAATLVAVLARQPIEVDRRTGRLAWRRRTSGAVAADPVPTTEGA